MTTAAPAPIAMHTRMPGTNSSTGPARKSPKTAAPIAPPSCRPVLKTAAAVPARAGSTASSSSEVSAGTTVAPATPTGTIISSTSHTGVRVPAHAMSNSAAPSTS